MMAGFCVHFSFNLFYLYVLSIPKFWAKSSSFQPKPGSKKVSVDELRKRDKECRRLKHELETEKEKFNQMVAKNAADLQNLQAGQ